MPTFETVERFVARVESGSFVEAIEEFYAQDATTRENNQEPLIGKDALLANERKVLAETRTVTAKCLGPIFVNGDRVVIRWLFVFETFDGKTKSLDELAYQRWTDEQILEEQFFYDPRQLKACA